MSYDLSYGFSIFYYTRPISQTGNLKLVPYGRIIYERDLRARAQSPSPARYLITVSQRGGARDTENEPLAKRVRSPPRLSNNLVGYIEVILFIYGRPATESPTSRLGTGGIRGGRYDREIIGLHLDDITFVRSCASYNKRVEHLDLHGILGFGVLESY